MKGWTKQSKSLVGLDIGRTSIKAVQITMQAKGPRIDGALCVARSSVGGPLRACESDRLTRVMNRRGLDATRVALIARSDALISTSINLPPADHNVARDPIVKMELSRAHRLVPDAFEYTWWDLPVSASGAHVGQSRAVALPHVAVSATLDTLDALGLEVVRTLPVSVALLAAAQHRPIDPRRIVAVMDMGSDTAHLVLMHAGRVVHERALPEFKAAAIQQRLQTQLGTSGELTKAALGYYGLSTQPEGFVSCEVASVLSEALAEVADQIGMSFAYISHLYPEAELGPLLLVGGAANIPGLAEALSCELELETARMTPADLCANPYSASESSDPALTAVLGAALTVGGEA